MNSQNRCGSGRGRTVDSMNSTGSMKEFGDGSISYRVSIPSNKVLCDYHESIIMRTGPSPVQVRRGKNNLEILMYIVISMAIVFYIDTVTPIGLAAWILYFIPLFLTIYMSWKYAPFLAAGACILLTFIGFFLSPLGSTPIMFELLNRVFFSLMLLIAAYLIYWMVNFTTHQLYPVTDFANPKNP